MTCWVIDAGPASKTEPRKYKTLRGVARHGIAAFLRGNLAELPAEFLILQVKEVGGWANFVLKMDAQTGRIVEKMGRYTDQQMSEINLELERLEHV